VQNIQDLEDQLVGASVAMTKSDALKLEYRVKHVPADSKYYELITNQIDLKFN